MFFVAGLKIACSQKYNSNLTLREEVLFVVGFKTVYSQNSNGILTRGKFVFVVGFKTVYSQKKSIPILF